VLVPALSLLRERHPQVRTSLLQGHTRGQLTELRDGKLDIAFIYGTCDGVSQRPVLTLPVVGVCASGHPLATGAPVRWPELARYRCLLPSQSTSPAIRDAVTTAARADEIVTFASSVRAETVRVIGLATLSFVDPVPEVTVYATWRDQDANPAVPLFLSTVEETRAGRAR
jgi:DNA-binding transcriptional LysR family regulator